jgi:hypothetical protein
MKIYWPSLMSATLNLEVMIVNKTYLEESCPIGAYVPMSLYKIQIIINTLEIRKLRVTKCGR